MRLNEHDLGLIAVGATLVLLIGFVAYVEMDTGDKSQPRYEGALATAGLSGVVIDQLDTGDHYFHPNYCTRGQTQIFLPIRYPQVSGGNITALIHRGFDPMRRRAPQDADWLERPPSEVMF